MNSARQTRSAGIDAVRLIGIAAVIFGHVYTGPLTHEFVYAWHVPLFFFITGYLWTRDRTMDRELRNRWRTLAVPYLGWFAMISVLLVVDLVRTGAGLSWTTFLSPALGGSHARGAYGTFWFVSVLFFTAVLYRLLERLPAWCLWSVAALGLAGGHLFGGWLAATPLAIGSALPCLFFVACGAMLRRWENRHPIAPWIGVPLLVVPLLVIAVVDPQDIDIKQGLYGTPVLGPILAVSISFGLILVAKGVPFPRAIAAGVTELAIVGIAVVLSHPIVLVYGRALELPQPTLLLAALILPWAVALLMHRTPLSPLLIGAPSSTRKPRDPDRR